MLIVGTAREGGADRAEEQNYQCASSTQCQYNVDHHFYLPIDV